MRGGVAFGRVLQGRAPTYGLLCVGLVSGALAWASERRGMLIATLLSAIGLIVALGWIVASRTLLARSADGRNGARVRAARHPDRRTGPRVVSPAPATPALLFAGAIAVWAAIFSCYALAFRAQSPLLALIPPLRVGGVRRRGLGPVLSTGVRHRLPGRRARRAVRGFVADGCDRGGRCGDRPGMRAIGSGR